MQYEIFPLTVTMLFGGVENTVHPTLLLCGDSAVLVDCGYSGSLPLLEKELQRYGLTAIQVTDVVLTHHDHDHMGAAAALKRLNPAVKIHAAAFEAPFITSQEKPLRLQQAEEMQKMLPPAQQSFGEAFCAMLRRVEPVSVDELLHDGETLSCCTGCHVIATPGHTPGHISLWSEQDNIVITGDAIALEGGIPVIVNPQFTLDLAQATASMEQLLSLHATAYYCYHGGIYVPENETK